MPKSTVHHPLPLTRQQKRWVKIIGWLVILGGLALWARHAFAKVHAQSMLKSCYNHNSFVEYELLEQYPGGIPDERLFVELPYDPELPGYAVMAKYGSSHHGALNCNHGAPFDLRGGGWNMVNLTPEKWDQLWKAHLRLRERHKNDTHYYVYLPLYWCGRDTGFPERAGGGLGRDGDGRWYLDTAAVDKEMLAHLNDCLVAIGEPPMDWNIPEGIDWDVYYADTSYKRIVDHTNEGGEVIYKITPRRGEAAQP